MTFPREVASLPVFAEFNPDAARTIILIHGAFSSHLEWDLVWPHLSNYHILAPDLPSHGAKSESYPFSVPLASHLIRDLIQAKAHNGIAHIVGLSLGAQVAVHLISHFPECVSDSFVTGFGFNLDEKTLKSWSLPYSIWMINRMEWAQPRSLVRWLMDGADLPRPDLSKVTLKRIRQIFNAEGVRWPKPWPARTLVVAAGKRGLLPTNDNADQARELAEIGRKLNPETKAVTNAVIRHPWSRQVPVLFAECVVKWIEGEELPPGFVEL